MMILKFKDALIIRKFIFRFHSLGIILRLKGKLSAVILESSFTCDTQVTSILVQIPILMTPMAVFCGL